MWKQLCATVSRILDAGFKILILHAGYCILDAAWMLDLGSWIPNAPGSWILDSEVRILDAGTWILDAES